MRNLTITRQASNIACLVEVKVYIEDAGQQELVIRETPCRLLGTLKNGETAVFPIESDAAWLFVIIDPLSRDYCCDCYRLPAGEADIVLSGQNRFNPLNGNAFRFADNNSPEAAAFRRRGTRKGGIISIALLALSLLFVFVVIGAAFSLLFSSPIFSRTPDPQQFTAHELSITLTEEFREVDHAWYTACYQSPDVAVFVLCEPLSMLPDVCTVDDYGALVQQANRMADIPLQTERGLTYFTCEFTDSKRTQTYRFVNFLFKVDACFWLVQFAAPTEQYDEHAEAMMNWAASITFS